MLKTVRSRVLATLLLTPAIVLLLVWIGRFAGADAVESTRASTTHHRPTARHPPQAAHPGQGLRARTFNYVPPLNKIFGRLKSF
jgi:hypothetical protein